jgi:hypothetical protein
LVAELLVQAHPYFWRAIVKNNAGSPENCNAIEEMD